MPLDIGCEEPAPLLAAAFCLQDLGELKDLDGGHEEAVAGVLGEVAYSARLGEGVVED